MLVGGCLFWGRWRSLTEDAFAHAQRLIIFIFDFTEINTSGRAIGFHWGSICGFSLFETFENLKEQRLPVIKII
jgi:hypothetical protein